MDGQLAVPGESSEYSIPMVQQCLVRPSKPLALLAWIALQTLMLSSDGERSTSQLSQKPAGNLQSLVYRKVK